MKQTKFLFKGKGEDPKVSQLRREFVEQLNSKAKKTLYAWFEAIEKDAKEEFAERLKEEFGIYHIKTLDKLLKTKIRELKK
jgi:hypothetical protein